MSDPGWKAVFAFALAMTTPGTVAFASLAGPSAGGTVELRVPVGATAFAMADLVFEAADNGKTVTVAVGARFLIRLEENPTTGYKWSEPEYDRQCLQLGSNEYQPPAGGALGAGGVRELAFVAGSSCRTTIRLAYKRPWEAGAAPAATFELTVVAAP